MKLHHIALNTTRYKETIAFYKEMFEMREIRCWEKGGTPGCMLEMDGGAMLEIFGVSAKEESDGKFIHIAFSTEDVDSAYEKALTLGAVADMEPFDIIIPSNPQAPLRIAFVRGFGGERIELLTEK